MATLDPSWWIITLNVNGLNYPIKRHRVGEWIINIFNYILFIRDSLTLDLWAYIGESESIKIRYSLQIVTSR